MPTQKWGSRGQLNLDTGLSMYPLVLKFIPQPESSPSFTCKNSVRLALRFCVYKSHHISFAPYLQQLHYYHQYPSLHAMITVAPEVLEVQTGPLQFLLVQLLAYYGDSARLLACCKQQPYGSNSSHSYQHAFHDSMHLWG